MITFGDIINKPKIILFRGSGDDTFYVHCRTREVEIKEALDMSFRTFNHHVTKFQANKEQLSKWEKEKVKSCMTNLELYMEYLLGELDKQKIEKYCQLADKMPDKFIPFLPDMILMLINSYQGAVETDLHWVTDLTMADTIDISLGNFDFEKLKKYLPTRIQAIQQLLLDLHKIDYVGFRQTAIEEAIQSYETGKQQSSNLLLLTVIEGLVRSLGIYLVQKQGLTVNPHNKYKYASLEGFLKIPWKKDNKIDEIKYGLLTGDGTFYKPGQPKFITTNLTERLGFLTRRFKENRNDILHGEDTAYATTLNSFLNFTALHEVLLTIREYKTLYQ